MLDLLLGNHSKVVSIGELRRLHDHYNGNYACTCDILLRGCDFWSGVEKKLNIENLSLLQLQTLIPRSNSVWVDLAYLLPDFLLRPLTRHVGQLSRDIQIAKNNLRIVDALCEENRVRYLVDSSKVYKFSRLYHLLRPQSSKTVFLLRDGRGVCHSRSKRGLSFKSSSRKWVTSRIKFFLLSALIPRKNKLTVSYEALCQSPEREMTTLCEFIGVPFEPGCTELIKQGKHNICGSPMRFRTEETQIELDESWRTELSDREKQEFRRSGAGIINRMLGYRSSLSSQVLNCESKTPRQ